MYTGTHASVKLKITIPLQMSWQLNHDNPDDQSWDEDHHTNYDDNDDDVEVYDDDHHDEVYDDKPNNVAPKGRLRQV